MSREFPKSFYLFSILILIIANVWLYQALLAPRELEVAVLEVGKGGAAFVRTPNGTTFLIDAGPDASILRALGGKLSPWRRSIDVVILTNSAARSAGGLSDVLNRYRVSNLVRFGAEGSKSFEFALAAALGREEDLRQTRAPYGARFRLGKVSIDIISPGTFSISSGSASLTVSSSTPEGLYTLDEKEIEEN